MIRYRRDTTMRAINGIERYVPLRIDIKLLDAPVDIECGLMTSIE